MIDSLNPVLKSGTLNRKRFCLLPNFGAGNRSGSFSLVSVFLSPHKFHFRKTLKNPRLLPTSSRGLPVTLLKIRINFRAWHTRTGCLGSLLSPKNLPAPQHYRRLQGVFLLDAEPAQKPGIKTPRATPFLAASLFRITTTLKTTSTSVS